MKTIVRKESVEEICSQEPSHFEQEKGGGVRERGRRDKRSVGDLEEMIYLCHRTD
jgi:hypothetical protein